MREYGEFLSEEGRMTVSMVRDFVNREIMPVRQQLDEDEDRGLVKHIVLGLTKLGVQRLGLATSVGGVRPDSTVTYAAVAEEVARGDSGIALTMTIPSWVFGPATRSRNNKVVNELCAPFCKDELHEACFAMTEPEGGCNIENPDNKGKTIRTRATLDGDELVINGSKCFPSGASVGEVYLVISTTDPQLGEEGVALIYVPVGVSGLSFGKPENKMGMRYTDVNSDIYLENVRVPREYRAGGPGKDYECLLHALAWGRLTSAAFAVGNAQSVFDIALEFTSTRFYGGKQVRQHSLQTAILADMAIAIESARFYYLSVCKMFDNREVYGQPHDDYLMSKASGAKMYATDVAVNVCNRAMELMGSYGYMKEYHVEKYLRDCKIIQLWEGGSHAGRIDVARGYYPMVPMA